MIIVIKNQDEKLASYLSEYLYQRLDLDYPVLTNEQYQEIHDGIILDKDIVDVKDSYYIVKEDDKDLHEKTLEIIKGTGLSKVIRIDDEVSLISYYPAYDITLDWYQDIQLVKQCDNKEEPYSLELLSNMYNYLSKRGYCYYICYKNELVGDVTLQDDGEISIVIKKQAQNKHIGRKTIEKIIELGREKKLDKVYAHIFSFNAQSQKVFEKCGFEKIDEEHYEYRLNDMKVKRVGIVSLSKGTIGEDFVKHELEIGIRRLIELGLEVSFMPNALKGIDYLEKNPQKRAEDLLEAYNSDVDMILCAIGGDDTYRLLPYLFDHDELKKVVDNRIFLGFSDSTMNHLMLNKLGIKTFYGQSFLADICEIDQDMLEYSKKYFEELITTGTIKEITPCKYWVESRKDYSIEAIGSSCPRHDNQGFELLQGPSIFKGKILGGCIDTLYDIFDNTRYSDSVELCNRYNLFPKKEDWKDKILLLESSEEEATPEHYKEMLMKLKETGIFEVISGIIVGKPCDEVYYDEYKKILVEVVDNPKLSILYNVNIGHSTPRCIIPLNVDCEVDYNLQIIKFKR